LRKRTDVRRTTRIFPRHNLQEKEEQKKEEQKKEEEQGLRMNAPGDEELNENSSLRIRGAQHGQFVVQT
jgi:hypothetical protein